MQSWIFTHPKEYPTAKADKLIYRIRRHIQALKKTMKLT